VVVGSATVDSCTGDDVVWTLIELVGSTSGDDVVWTLIELVGSTSVVGAAELVCSTVSCVVVVTTGASSEDGAGDGVVVCAEALTGIATTSRAMAKVAMRPLHRCAANAVAAFRCPFTGTPPFDVWMCG